jgi:hypothetical protein
VSSIDRPYFKLGITKICPPPILQGKNKPFSNKLVQVFGCDLMLPILEQNTGSNPLNFEIFLLFDDPINTSTSASNFCF